MDRWMENELCKAGYTAENVLKALIEQSIGEDEIDGPSLEILEHLDTCPACSAHRDRLSWSDPLLAGRYRQEFDKFLAAVRNVPHVPVQPAPAGEPVAKAVPAPAPAAAVPRRRHLLEALELVRELETFLNGSPTDSQLKDFRNKSMQLFEKLPRSLREEACQMFEKQRQTDGALPVEGTPELIQAFVHYITGLPMKPGSCPLLADPAGRILFIPKALNLDPGVATQPLGMQPHDAERS